LLKLDNNKLRIIKKLIASQFFLPILLAKENKSIQQSIITKNIPVYNEDGALQRLDKKQRPFKLIK
jgi:hypothetical protein